MRKMINAVTVRKIKIGEGMPKICVPVVGVTEEEILSEARNAVTFPVDLVEWRGDWFADIAQPEPVKRVLAGLREILGEMPLLFTFRTAAEGGERKIDASDYEDINGMVIGTGYADMVDVEFFMGQTEKEMISGFRNPNYMISQHPSGGNNLQINGSAYLQITPVRNLNIKSVFGTNAYAYWGYAYEYPTYSGSLGNGTVSRVHQNGGTFTVTNTIDYNFDFDNADHKLYLLAGQEGILNDGLTFSAQRSGQIRNDLMMLSTAAGVPAVADSKSSYAFNSWFARSEYSYMNKYVFDASV